MRQWWEFGVTATCVGNSDGNLCEVGEVELTVMAMGSGRHGGERGPIRAWRQRCYPCVVAMREVKSTMGSERRGSG